VAVNGRRGEREVRVAGLEGALELGVSVAVRCHGNYVPKCRWRPPARDPRSLHLSGGGRDIRNVRMGIRRNVGIRRQLAQRAPTPGVSVFREAVLGQAGRS